MQIHKAIIFLGTLLAVNLMPHSAHANELRVGLMAQDIPTLSAGMQGKESSTGLSLDIVFDTPTWLEWLPLDPKPYIGGTLNLEGKTNYGGAGLIVQPKITESFYSEFGVGLVLHDGTLEIAVPTIDQTPDEISALNQRNATEIEFGSPVLFRLEVAMGYRINDKWSLEAVYEHLSHGQIFTSGPNEGLDSAGLRIARRF